MRFGKVDPMLRIGASLRNSDTASRLRRGIGSRQESVPVEVMARAACFSRRQFHRLMVEMLGERPGSHQRRIRLDRATRMLLTSRVTILEIALENGFENPETFTRAFRARFGVTPSSFRRNRGANLPRSIRMGLAMAVHVPESHNGD
jgi:AraC-like DNA-binding protein